MEDKWDIYAFNDVFYFCSSWLNNIALKAGFEQRPDENRFNVTWIEFSESHHMTNAGTVTQQVDFLIKTMLGLRLPLPVPLEVEPTVKEYSRYAGTVYGSFAYFATNEDTTKIRLLESGTPSLDEHTPMAMDKETEAFYQSKFNK